MRHIKSGFTLIELLAVIVILAIIALIATPIVLNIIEDSKKSAFIQTGNGIIDAAEYYYMNQMLGGQKPTTNVIINFPDVGELEFEGEIPNYGTLIVNKDGKIKIEAHNNRYCITKGFGDTNIEIKDYDGDCSIHVCTLIDDVDNSGTITQGDKYECKVKDTMKNGYYFYVLSQNSDGTTNLIMERNICEDGSFATEQNTCLVAWNSNGTNADGPVTAMDYLYNATKDWNNIPNMVMNYTYDSDENGYKSIITTKLESGDLTKITRNDGTNVTVLTNKEGYENLKARIPNIKESFDYSETRKNAYFYDYLSLNGSLQKNPISGITGYWILDFSGTVKAWIVHAGGYLHWNYNVDNNNTFGIRPVITLVI